MGQTSVRVGGQGPSSFLTDRKTEACGGKDLTKSCGELSVQRGSNKSDELEKLERVRKTLLQGRLRA